MQSTSLVRRDRFVIENEQLNGYQRDEPIKTWQAEMSVHVFKWMEDSRPAKLTPGVA